MVRIGAKRGRDVRPAGDRAAGPETGAEKAERERFEEARREGKIISGVRTKIDRCK